MLKTTGITFTAIYARNFAKMLEFYRDTLGFRESGPEHDPGTGYEPGVDFAYLYTGNGHPIELLDLGVHGPRQSHKVGPEGGNSVLFGFGVESVEETVQILKGKGVQFETGILEEDWGSGARFLDPEENAIDIFDINTELYTAECGWIGEAPKRRPTTPLGQ
jgi:catechol 2,3-dioxygenase-like lactoylglutathione lyase family enzyme